MNMRFLFRCVQTGSKTEPIPINRFEKIEPVLEPVYETLIMQTDIEISFNISFRSSGNLNLFSFKNRIESNRTESNQIKPNQTESNRIQSNQFYRSESNFFNISMFFRVRFDRTGLIKIIRMHQIHHVKSFKCIKTEFGQIEPNK